MRSSIVCALMTCGLAATAAAKDLAPIILPPAKPPSEQVKPYVKMPAGSVALTNVRVIDGTGSAVQSDKTVLLEGGRIKAVQDASTPVPSGFTALDFAGSTVLPGIVGMHNHMFHIARPNLEPSGKSEQPLLVPQMMFSSPRLYLANGVTTIRTTGSVEPYADLNLKHGIDAGEFVGPHMDVTGPYLEGAASPFIQMNRLATPEATRKMVAYWADQGVTSFKAYMNITRAELKVAIGEAHRRGLKITGHLCAVTYDEAADLDIDNLEHGFWVNTANDPNKKHDECPPTVGAPTLDAMDPDGPAAKTLIARLVARRVAITSTLPAFDPDFAQSPALYAKALEAMTPQAREAYLIVRARITGAPEEQRRARERRWRNELALERQFVAAGGLLIAGPDPTSTGGILPGFGDLRGVELLVEAGFTPIEAIKIATLNGATYLGLQNHIGSIAPGKNADLFIVKGDPSKAIADIANVQLVFKDGVAYDTEKLLASVKGRYGQY